MKNIIAKSLGTAMLAGTAMIAFSTPAAAEECLLDTNDNGVADPLDTDGGATSDDDTALACGVLAEANGPDAMAIGTDSSANGPSTTAVGGESFVGQVAPGSNLNGGGLVSIGATPGASAFGWRATATAERATAVGHLASASGVRSVAVGEDASASADLSVAVGDRSSAVGDASIAIGNASVADGVDAVAIGGDNDGTGAVATGNSTTAIGGEAFVGTVAAGSNLNGGGLVATGGTPGATALGWRATATAERATALGHLASAGGVRSVAVGEDAGAMGDGSIAIGNQSSATGVDSIAIGNGAVAANDGQVVIANLDTSTASQMGSLSVVTADANGTLGLSSGFASSAVVASNSAAISTNAGNIAALQTLTTNQTARIDELFGRADANSAAIDRANEGVAMALAMESPMLPAGTNFALSGGVGYFENQGAGTIAMTARVGENAAFSAGVGVGFDSGEVGARGGFQIAW